VHLDVLGPIAREVRVREAPALVSSAGAGPRQRVPVWQQGDLEFYTTAAMYRRRALRYHPSLAASLRRHWHRVSTRSDGTPGGSARRVVTREVHELFFRNAYELLLGWREDAFNAQIAEDWQRDMTAQRVYVCPFRRRSRQRLQLAAARAVAGRGGSADDDGLEFAGFVRALFELIDMWTASTDVRDYVDLSESLRWGAPRTARVTKRPLKDRMPWRPSSPFVEVRASASSPDLALPSSLASVSSRYMSWMQSSAEESPAAAPRPQSPALPLLRLWWGVSAPRHRLGAATGTGTDIGTGSPDVAALPLQVLNFLPAPSSMPLPSRTRSRSSSPSPSRSHSRSRSVSPTPATPATPQPCCRRARCSCSQATLDGSGGTRAAGAPHAGSPLLPSPSQSPSPSPVSSQPQQHQQSRTDVGSARRRSVVLLRSASGAQLGATGDSGSLRRASLPACVSATASALASRRRDGDGDVDGGGGVARAASLVRRLSSTAFARVSPSLCLGGSPSSLTVATADPSRGRVKGRYRGGALLWSPQLSTSTSTSPTVSPPAIAAMQRARSSNNRPRSAPVRK
jgi:hypothetical protein